MACNCGKPEGSCSCNKDCHASPAVLQINNPPEYNMFHKIDVPVSFGDDKDFPPLNGKYKNVVLHYEKNGAVYLYSSDGIPTKLTYEESIEAIKKPYISLRRLGSYTYEITFDEMPEYRPSNIITGSCSSFVKDGKLYRNFDWHYDEAPTFIVKCKGFTGIANGDKLVDSELNDDIALSQLPYRIVDGYNDNGIMMSTHVLYNDWGWNGVGDKSITLQRLPYTVLKKVKSMATINEDLASTISNLAGLESEYLLQLIITDGETTYALLPPQSSTGAYELVDITSNPKLTNFRWVANKTVERGADYMQTRPTGVERWNEMTEDMSELRFTKAYESNARLSEFIGINGTTKASPDSDLQSIYNLAHGKYLNRTRNGEIWQTVHSVVYSKHGMEHLYTQENWDVDYIVEDGELAELVGEKLKPYIDSQDEKILEESNKYTDKKINELIEPEYFFDTHFAPASYGGGCQGGCVLPDGSIIQFTGEGSNLVKKFDPNGALIKTASVDFGHCNCCCYCSKTNTVFVPQDNIIHEIDPDTLNTINDYNVTGQPSYLYGMVYDEKKDQFIFVKWWGQGTDSPQYMWKTDSSFELIPDSVKNFNFTIPASSYFGKFGEYLAFENIQDHEIKMFDYDLNFVGVSKIHELVGDTWWNTETEWFDTLNGVVYIGFVAGYSASPHRGSLYVYGKCDTNNNYRPSKKHDVDTVSPHREIYYVDNVNGSRLDRDGSYDNPFFTVYEAINSSLRKENVNGSVTIVLNNAATPWHYPIFTAPKEYLVKFLPSGDINWFRGIAVDAGCKVTIDCGLSLKTSTKENPFEYGNGGDLCVMGELVVSGKVRREDGASVILNGHDGSYIKMGVTDGGIDVNDFWGELVDNNFERKISDNLVKNLSSQGSNRNRQINILNYQLTPVDGVYTIPLLSSHMIAYIRFIDNRETFEISVPVTPGLYQRIPVFSGTDLKYIEIPTDRTVIGEGVTIDRVLISA